MSEYKYKSPSGETVEIHHDSDVERPFENDNYFKIVVLHRRYTDPSKGECGSAPEEVAQWEKENAKDWHILPLFMLDHSNTTYRAGKTNPFGNGDIARFDSGRVGIVAQRKDIDGIITSEEDFKKSAKNNLETYTAWANGETFGYKIKDENDQEDDSCWGYYGLDDVLSAAADYLGVKPEDLVLTND